MLQFGDLERIEKDAVDRSLRILDMCCKKKLHDTTHFEKRNKIKTGRILHLDGEMHK